MLRPPPPPPRAEEEAPVFSPLLLPPHRSARAERPEAGGRSGEEAPGSPRRGRLGPPPAPLRSALLLAAGQPQRLRITAPQSAGAASQSARGRGAAPRRQPPGLQRGARRGGKRPGGGWGTGTGGPPRARAPPGVEKAVCGRPPALSFCQTPLSSQSPSCPLARYVPAGFRTPERVP